MRNEHKIILIGAPGAGKGTQAKFISKAYGIPQISTGDILRSEISKKSDLGKEANSYIEKGLLVPDAVVTSLVENRVENPDCEKGYILDGFPRTVPQAQAMIDRNIEIGIVLLIDAADDVILDRLSGRLVCPNCSQMYHKTLNPPKILGICDKCGSNLNRRKDDEPDTIKRRIQVFRELTAPMIDFFQKLEDMKVIKIEGGSDRSETPEVIFSRIKSALDRNSI